MDDFPKLDGFSKSLEKLDYFESTMEKLDFLTFNSSKLASFDAGFARYDAQVLKAGKYMDSVVNSPDIVEFRRASSSLSQGQRGWLAKGLRDWSSYVDKALRWLAVEVKRHPSDGVFDLRSFLLRRQIQGLQRRALWANSKGEVRAWIRELGMDLLARVAARLRTGAGPKVLLALLKSPPGWSVAVRFRLSLEATLPTIIDQLIQVLSPNAPSISPERLSVQGGSVT